MTAVTLQNPDLLRRLAEPTAPATIAALATEQGRDPANLRKTLKRMEGEGTVSGLALTDLGRRVLLGLDVADGRAEVTGAARPGDLIEVHPAQLRPDPDQPRKVFDPVALEALAQSIADKGVLQPILVRPAAPVPPTDDAYPADAHMIIAGERRFRACMKIVNAGEWPEGRTITVRVATPEDEAEAFELAVVENMQRDQLNHMEMGHAFERMAVQGGRSNADIAQSVGRTPEFVQQHRRLTRLDPEYQAYVADGRLSMHEALRLLAGPSKGPASPQAQPAAAAADDDTLPTFDPAQQPQQAAEPAPETKWTQGGFVMIQELRASGRAIPSECSRAPVARLYRKGDAFEPKYRVEVVVDFGGGRTIESSVLPGAQRADIAVACATDDIIARWPKGQPPRGLIEWLDKATGAKNVVAGRFCETSEAAEARRIALGWVMPAEPAPDAQPELKPRHQLVLIELAHKIAAQRRPLDATGGAGWSGDPAQDYLAFGALCGSYWLDQAFNELATQRLVRAAHQPAGQGILAALTPKGVDWFVAEGVPLPPADFQVQDAQGAAGDAGKFHTPERYSTAWLAQEARQPVAADEAPADAAPDVSDDPWGRDEAAIAADGALLERTQDWVDGNDPLNDVSSLLTDLGVHEAKVHADGWVELLGVDGALVAEVTVDPNNRLPDERARALEHLVAWAINTVGEGC